MERNEDAQEKPKINELATSTTVMDRVSMNLAQDLERPWPISNSWVGIS